MRKQPMRPHRKEFIILSLCLLAARLLDLGTTYYWTPDLRNEANPFVALLGFGWPSLLVANALIVLGLLVALFFDYRLPGRYPQAKNLAFLEFSELYYFGKRRHFIMFFVGEPHGWYLRLKAFGYVAPRGVLALSVLAVPDWWWWAISKYQRMPALVHRLGLCIVAIGMIYSFIFLFLRREYRFYKVASMDDMGKERGTEKAIVK